MDKYDAFISYSHAADGKLAPALQKALQNIAKPFFSRKALNVFRDQTNLSATPHLWKNIEEALRQSKYLILLASPSSAQSKWVKQEIDFWLATKSADTILIALTEGDILWDDNIGGFDFSITNALPINLKGQFKMEPLFIDLRKAKNDIDLSLKNPIFREDSASLAAAIHQTSIDDLIGEDVKIQRRNKRITIIAIFLLTILTIGMGWFANDAYNKGLSLQKELDNSKMLRMKADSNAQIAQKNAQDAQKQEKIALTQKKIATIQRDSAEFERVRANVERDNAILQAKISEARRLLNLAKQEIDNKKQSEAVFLIQQAYRVRGEHSIELLETLNYLFLNNQQGIPILNSTIGVELSPGLNLSPISDNITFSEGPIPMQYDSHFTPYSFFANDTLMQRFINDEQQYYEVSLRLRSL